MSSHRWEYKGCDYGCHCARCHVYLFLGNRFYIHNEGVFCKDCVERVVSEQLNTDGVE